MSRELEKRLISIRRHLHQYPELSNEEFETTKSIKNWLEEEGIEIRNTGLKTGVFADIKGGKPGPTVAIRADIDALPIEEQTGLPFASKVKGVMHACGHDFHTAAAIGAAYLLKEYQSELCGTVRLLFQPAEELGGGAEHVIKDGQIDDVAAVIGLHNKPNLPVGTIGIKEGPLMAAVDRFHIVLQGKGSHAAIPQNGKDPIAAAAQLITALQTIVSRNVSPLDSAVVSVTRITGGNTWNVIPGDVILEGTIRTFNSEIREEVKEKFYSIVNHIAAAFSLEAAIGWFPGPPALLNHPAVTEMARLSARQQSLHVIHPEPSMGGEDFAYYLQHIPGTFAFFGTNGNEDWHHPAFTVDEKSIIKAAHFLSESAKDLLSNHGKW
ncbi:M20 peptidase aminoacylase family protein [Peribacillus simplex]|uniref:Hydrolase n=1 Tax=Peribacillus simplex NBRC 15720 = DSM 1321 TaxID=1349754 RepID=A0A223EFP9_9BACI|nr:M20 peptidase aminoacylase family protein [Peribacillus simplex]ASS94084.1 hydrolase [Peribacillus simplex NBRC 15720 = DSM 1321]MEC1400428.1 M20 peptidase aminoacylase family protein [Peribacillus simplex]